MFFCIDSSLTDLLSQQITSPFVMFQGVLDGLNLHGDGRQDRFLQTVKLIKAAPRSTLQQAHKDPSHGLHIDALQKKQTAFHIIGFHLLQRLTVITYKYMNSCYRLCAFKKMDHNCRIYSVDNTSPNRVD